MKKKVIVGISGGVDSAVSAYILKKQGFEVEGLFMKNWEDDDDASYCAAAEDLAIAQSICDELCIPLHTVNFSAQYWQKVFRHFLDEYEAGRTPNPDILCNKEIKFTLFPEYARRFGAQWFASGHYAVKSQHENIYRLLRGIDGNKDQSYFLHSLSQQQMAHHLFPVGEYTKPHVRQLAYEAGLPNYDRKDSTGICFIGERRFSEFLQRYLAARPGPVCDPHGAVLGEHQGVYYYTLGQRQGLGIGGKKDAGDKPWYVAAKDVNANTLTVVQGHDHPWLFSRELVASPVHWISAQVPDTPFVCTAKVRYRQDDQPCTITCANEQWRVTFDEPVWAVTPGQSVVFYQREICLGGGVITNTNQTA